MKRVLLGLAMIVAGALMANAFNVIVRTDDGATRITVDGGLYIYGGTFNLLNSGNAGKCLKSDGSDLQVSTEQRTSPLRDKQHKLQGIPRWYPDRW